MSFRIWTIFYVFALFAAAMATFGPWGILIAVGVLLFWGGILYGEKQRARLLELLIVVVILGMLVALLLPSVQSARESSRTVQCLNNLKILSLALGASNNKTGALPPAYLVVNNSKPLLSWRILILPFMEEQAVYDGIDRTRAWNDPANRPMTSIRLSDYQCPQGTRIGATTDYLAVVGPQTAWPGARGRSISEITDGASQTILLIECHTKSIHWAEPNDLTFDEAVDLLSKPVPPDDGHFINNGFFYKSERGRFIAFADSSVLFLKRPLDRKLAAALLTVNGGESIDVAVLDAAIEATVDYAKCYIFGLFVILSLLPAISVRKQRKKLANGA